MIMEYIIIGIILLAILFICLLKTDSKNTYEREQREIKDAGNFGEAICKSEIKQILRSDDILINNICLNINGKETEIDNLIINKNGIFIIEVKNYNGTLYGDIDDFEWEKRKVSLGGNVFTKEVKNPIRQMKRQTYLLSRYLKDNGIWIWISPYAYFINDNSPVDDESVISDIQELDKIIHKPQEKIYDDKVISKAVKLLSN